MDSVSHSHILTVDQGNSSAKVVVWDGDTAVNSVRLFDVAIENLLPLIGDLTLDGGIYCSVGHTDAKFLESLRCLLDGRLEVLTPSTPLPIGVRYSSRQSLGNDRVAAAAGAVALHPGSCSLVVDAGTAVTIDVVSDRGVFLGGNIAPGVSLRLRSLHNYTDRLPLVEAAGSVPDFGHDTVTAIRAGVLGGMAAEIAVAFDLAHKKYGCRRVLLTGNDAHLITRLLARNNLNIEVLPNLVGRGLLSIFNHNSDNPDLSEI